MIALGQAECAWPIALDFAGRLDQISVRLFPFLATNF